MKKIIFAIVVSVMGLAFAKELTVSVGAGKNWKQKMNPQCGIWLEDADGEFVRTLFVTTRASRKNWIFGPKEGRPESLPVWYGADGKQEDFDAVTRATPKGGMIFTFSVEDDKDYLIKAEFNNSFDYNEAYTKKNSGVNGQPSVVYGARIPAGFTEEIRLEFLGTGSVDGSDCVIHEAEGLTTAENIVQCIAVVNHR